jgi:predicted nucleic acid-binding protein
VIFVDTNVFVYAVGRSHPLREPARALLRDHMEAGTPLATSAEVLQELMHVYLPVGRLETLDAALALANDLTTVLPVDDSDARTARDLVANHPGLGARDLLHLAVCLRHQATQILSFDRGLVAAFKAPRPS